MMKLRPLLTLSSIACLFFFLLTVDPKADVVTGCSSTPLQIQNIENAVLSAEQVACIFASSITDAPALAKACNIADAVLPTLLPLIEKLIGQREAAKRAGAPWPSTPTSTLDGGREGGKAPAADAGKP
jgi:hypothetical protein